MFLPVVSAVCITIWVYLGVRTCELFLCFVAIVRVRVIMLTSLFSLFYVTGEFLRFLHRGRAHNLQNSTSTLTVVLVTSGIFINNPCSKLARKKREWIFSDQMIWFNLLEKPCSEFQCADATCISWSSTCRVSDNGCPDFTHFPTVCGEFNVSNTFVVVLVKGSPYFCSHTFCASHKA